MTDLPAFLLARINEDERPTWELVPYRCEPGCCAPAGFVGHRCIVCGTEEFGGTVAAITEISQDHDERVHRRARVLAECEAKRQVVKTLTDEWWSGNVMLNERLLGLMALVYFDHPDYRQEWTP